MNYTIIYTEDLLTKQTIDISKSGNFYTVGLYDHETNEIIVDTVKTRSEAFEKYNKIIKCFVTSCYSWNDRKKILKNELEFNDNFI